MRLHLESHLYVRKMFVYHVKSVCMFVEVNISDKTRSFKTPKIRVFVERH